MADTNKPRGFYEATVHGLGRSRKGATGDKATVEERGSD